MDNSTVDEPRNAAADRTTVDVPPAGEEFDEALDRRACLAPARGSFLGIALGAIIWGALALVVWRLLG